MARKIFCRKYQKELDGLDFPPFPGSKGQDIFDHISKQAWLEWQQHQTMLINEKRLNMMEPDARKYLEQERDKFFSGDDYEKPEGYVPPEN